MALPVIRGASAALYPFKMTFSFLTGMGVFQSGAEQRSVKRPGIVKFEIPYANLTQAQKNTVKAAVTSANGQFDTTLTLTLGATTYTNLSLDSDDFVATESMNTIYAAPLKLSQIISQGISPGGLNSGFPRLTNGVLGILPFSQGKRWQTVSTQTEAGPKYTLAEFAGGWTGYPTDGLMHWRLDESALTDADTTIRINHFCANYGRAGQFAFADEDGTVYSKVRYGSDDLVVEYTGFNSSRITTELVQTN
jgi:hypothetical protein